jgi:glycolate oxidase FAD binding subunit
VSTVAQRIAEVQDAVRAAPPAPRLLPVAGATKPALSTPPPGDGAVALDVSGLRGIVEYDPAELTFTALAATPVAEVVEALAEHGQYLPFDPPFAAAGATLGGAVASGTSGANAFRHGGVRDFVIGVRFVDGTGRVVAGGGKVVKNAAGFDFPKAMVGSMGRLGIMVQLSFKVFPCPRATTTLAFDLGSLAAALAASARLVRGPMDLEALDLEPGGRVLVRLGGDPGALDARAARLARELGTEPAQRDDGTDDGARWRDAAELRWAPPGSTIVRAALTARSVTALDTALAAAAAAATVRYGLGGNVAWIAWPAAAPLADLDGALRALDLTAVALTGAPLAGGPLLGAPRGGAFGARVRSALDPFARFLES